MTRNDARMFLKILSKLSGKNPAARFIAGFGLPNIIEEKLDGRCRMSDIFRLEERSHPRLEWPPQEDDSPVFQHRRQCDVFLEFLNARRRESLLDLGGNLRPMLAAAVRRGLRVTGLEYTPEDAAFSQKSAPEAMVVMVTAPEIPFENETFNLITCLDFPPHLQHPAALLPEIYRVLKPGGRACLLLPNSHYAPPRRAESYYSPERSLAYSRDEWEKMLWNSGLPAYKVRNHFDQVFYPETRTGAWLGIIGRFFRTHLGEWLPAIFTPSFAFFCKKS